VNDELRHRLGRSDPLRHDEIPATPPAHLLEQIMTNTLDTPTSYEAARPRRRWPVLAAAAAAVVVLAGTAVVLTGGDDPAAPPLALELPDDGGALSSCLAFDVAILAQMPLAFEGRAVEVADGVVTLDVTQWYAGGEAEQVTVAAATGMEALIGGIEFVPGGDYLITATDGTVNFCGYSAPATDDLRAAFAEAFPG
jgi:hypothetical protein